MLVREVIPTPIRYEKLFRLLKEKGWESGRDDWEEMLAKERQKTWELMEELVGDMDDEDTVRQVEIRQLGDSR